MDSPAAETSAAPERPQLAKAPTGITGLDEVTGGGLPRGRTTLVAGAAGAGKSLFGIEFLVRGARDFGEPGVLLSFEESGDELAQNVASLGFDVEQLERDGLLVVDAVHVDRSEFVETGAFDLEGLFLRLGAAVDRIGAKRVTLDTIEVLFSALGNEAIIRAELGRLFRWLKDRGLTAVVTGERGPTGTMTRFGIEEYVSDCVIVLDHRVDQEVSTRRLRVVKYRGSLHGTNEYPFLITEDGLVVVPITSVGLQYDAPTARVSTGVADLDEMLGGGVYEASTLLVGGGAGTGKTSIACHVVNAACERGDRALFFSLEESPSQLVRNMRSIGLDLQRWVDAGQLRMVSVRATASGLEEHLANLRSALDEMEPGVVVLDAIASLARVGTPHEISSIVARDLDLVRSRGITAVLTALTPEHDDMSGASVSSLVDAWIQLRNFEHDMHRTRLIAVIKSRGSAHSNRVREFRITDDGAVIADGVPMTNGTEGSR